MRGAKSVYIPYMHTIIKAIGMVLMGVATTRTMATKCGGKASWMGNSGTHSLYSVPLSCNARH